MSQATEVYGQDRKEVEKRMSESKGGVELDVAKITGLRGKRRHHRDEVRVPRAHPRQVT